MGVQGIKRKNILKKDYLYSVDKFKKAHFKNIKDVPFKKYDTAFICVPDNQKYKLANFCLKNNKNVLIEKPLIFKNLKLYDNLKKLAEKKNLALYTAYNHRFEPGIKKIKNFLLKKKIGKVFHCRIFYGNGTSRLVKKSKWRDKELGVISDIGSHLLDMCMFIFDKDLTKIKLVKANKFENKAPDHSIITLKYKDVEILLEMTLCSWENTFNCDIIGSKGSLHLNSLCKWSDSTFIYKKRKFPSGKPITKKIVFPKGDPTWELEHKYMKRLIKQKKKKIFIKKDILINKTLKILK